MLLYSLAALCVLSSLVTLYYHLKTGVPPFPSFQHECKAAVELLQKKPLKQEAIIYELGSGWGTLLIEIAKAFPQAQVIGIEISPLPYIISKLRTRHLSNAKVTRKDYFKENLSHASAITSYLMTPAMKPLMEKLDAELQAGTPVVSIAFLYHERKAIQTIPGVGLCQADVALYHWNL